MMPTMMPRLTEQNTASSQDLSDMHLLSSEKNTIQYEMPYHTSRPSQQRWITFLVMSNTFFLLATTVLGILYILPTPAMPHAQWFDTDIVDARTTIIYEKRDYNNQWRFNETSKTVYRDIDSSQTQYFGLPSPAIDAAWNDLLRNEFIHMTDEEAAPFGGRPTLVFDGRPLMEPVVFHALHCVNALRKHIDMDYYSVNEPNKMDERLGPQWKRDHIDHCLDLLFQQVKCHGDLTPSPMYSWDGFPVALGIMGTHTCRNFDAIRTWMDGRAEQDKQALSQP